MGENEMVVENGAPVQADDTLGLTEETPVEEEGESLQSILDEENADKPAAPEASANEKKQPDSEPGWIRKRIDAGVRKETERIEKKLRDEYEAKFAPVQKMMFENQADALVASGEFKTKATALEYVYMKNGVQPPEVQQQEKPNVQPRDNNGRFVAREQQDNQYTEDADVKQRASSLVQQAKTIRRVTGLDVLNVYNTNEQVKEKILSGEWDFADVAQAMSGNGRKVPTPTRSANGVGLTAVTPATMTDEQFRRLQNNLAQGKVYDMRK